MRKRNKYGAISVKVDGHFFPSTAEARRYGELKLLEKAGKIRGLRLQPQFPLFVNDHLICSYRGDFQFEEAPEWKLIVEDVKGFKTAVYRLKKALLKATQGIEIREVR